MPTSNLAPLAVVPFSKDYLVAFIRHQTRWTQRSEISRKKQLDYLCSYLEVDHIGVKTVVVESEYVDRHYLEDYSEYYARCFPYHPRKCSRLHFFSSSFDEDRFVEALNGNDTEFAKSLNDKYLGFAVIRPIPRNFLARLCLKRYDELAKRTDCRLIAKKIPVSLFGIPLTIESAAFLEQDKVVSACATSALWMLFNASDQSLNGSLPSPSAITKSATGSSSDGVRTFPATGLTPPQVARSLKHFGLEPLLINFDSDWSKFKELLYGYISNNIPVLVAGSIYKKSPDGSVTHAGKHLVCALGYRLGNGVVASDSAMQLMSHKIEKIYVHDDRYGPYVRVELNPSAFEIKSEKQATGFETRQGLRMSLHGVSEEEYFIPDMSIVGLYHKVRLSYNEIWEMCDGLFCHLKETRDRYDAALAREPIEDPKAREHYEQTRDSIGLFLSGTFDIALITNSSVKKDLLNNQSFTTYSGSASRSACLVQSMPKYIWRCRVHRKSEDATPKQLFTDILFDATEVAQGQVLVGYISYCNDAERMWNHVANSVDRNLWDGYQVTPSARQGIGAFLSYFSQDRNKASLNTLYGSLGLPRRNIKEGETDVFENISKRVDVLVIRRGNPSFWDRLDKAKPYIWVIDEAGDLVLGEDIHLPGEVKGHPTLVDGKAARLGGELLFDSIEQTWLANLKSRAYSGHISPGSELSRGYLSNVIEANFIGLEVKAQAPPSPTGP